MNIEKDDESSLVLRELPQFEVRAFDETRRTCDFVASTATVDAYNEIVEQSWILEHYRENPIVLYAHDRWDLPIGKSIRCEVVNDIQGTRLECTIEFATEAMNPKAEQVFQLVKEKFLRAVSVGFRPKDVRYEIRDGKEVYVLANNVLKEISVVPIGANPDALAKGGPDPIAHMKARAKSLAGSPPNHAPPAGHAAVERHAPAGDVARGQENVMDETKKQLEAKVGELAVANEKIAGQEKTIADLTTKATADADRATKAEAALETQLKAHREVVDAIDGALKAAGAPTTVDIPEPKPGGASTKSLTVAERIIAVAAQRDKAQAEVIERDVEAIVGVKIDPAQKDDFLALAKADRPRYDAIVKGLPDRKTLGTVIPSAKTHTSTAAADANGDELASLLGDGDGDIGKDDPSDLGAFLND